MTFVHKPIPEPDTLTQPFWDGVDQGRLTIQRCEDCSRFQHPPLAKCRHCDGTRFSAETISGRGHVYSYQIVHDTRIPQFKAIQPYTIVVVEAEESPDILFIANLVPHQHRPTIGDPVEVIFEDLHPGGRFLPQFQIRTGEL